MARAPHLPIGAVRELGLAVQALEDDPALGDAFLSIHNASLFTFMKMPSLRLFENRGGRAFIQSAGGWDNSIIFHCGLSHPGEIDGRRENDDRPPNGR